MLFDNLINSDELKKRVNFIINEKDNMFSGKEEPYFRVGNDALKLIIGFLTILRRDNPLKILDFACGYGRVARWIRAGFPEAEIIVSDTNKKAVNFCSEQFNTIPYNSNTNLDTLNLEKKFDLIWCGSLITHLDEGNAIKLINFFNRHLNDKGIAIFTSHGLYVADRWKSGSWSYKIKEAEYKEMSRIFHSSRYAYVDYEGHKGYGFSITPLNWYLETIANMKNIIFSGWIDRGWDKHQDAICISKTI